jgi:thiamine biosynthesis lipoprotein
VTISASPTAHTLGLVKPRGLHRVEPVMGTMVSIDVRDVDPPARAAGAVEAAIAWLHEVEGRFSPYRSASEICRIGAGTLAEGDAHPDVRAVLAMTDALAVDTLGAFDARRWRADGRVDPTGVVKGWSIQVAADALVSAGVRDFAIGAGGDIVARGGPEPGVAWRVGIRHPDVPDRVAAVLTVTDAAVATSAAYERGAHIRDPRTGHTPDGVRSVTVVGPSLTWADAYATAAYVMGRDGLAWVDGRPGYAALAIGWDDVIRWTSGMDRYLAR